MAALRNFILISLVLLVAAIEVNAQKNQLDDDAVIQLSGAVLTDESGAVMPLSFVNVYVKGTTRGTYSANDGFFSIVVRKSETIVFSTIGYKSVEYQIPDTLTTNRYTIFQILSKDNILLPETVIYPWPSREHFKLEFLAMDVSNELEDRAAENLSEKALAQLREFLPTDGGENVSYYLKKQADSYVYEGQFKPMKILDVFAWQKFIKAWKSGDFKKKDKK